MSAFSFFFILEWLGTQHTKISCLYQINCSIFPSIWTFNSWLTLLSMTFNLLIAICESQIIQIIRSYCVLKFLCSAIFTASDIPHTSILNISLFLPKMIFCISHSLFCPFSFYKIATPISLWSSLDLLYQRVKLAQFSLAIPINLIFSSIKTFFRKICTGIAEIGSTFFVESMLNSLETC